MKHLFWIIFVLLVLNFSIAQTSDWITQGNNITGWIVVRGSCTDAQLSGVNAQRRAIENARRKAVEEVCGVHVAAISLVDAGLLKGDITETFTFGWVAKDSLIDRGSASKTIGGYDWLVTEYWVVLACSVATRNSSYNSSLSIRAELDKKTYRAGERAELEIMANEDCYLTIFAIWADGTLGVLCPNEFVPEMRVKAGEIVKFPDPDLHKFELAFCTLPGDEENTEYIKIVATKKSYPFFGGVGTAALQIIEFDSGGSIKAISDRNAALEEFMLWFLSIPPEDVAVKQVVYVVVEK